MLEEGPFRLLSDLALFCVWKRGFLLRCGGGHCSNKMTKRGAGHDLFRPICIRLPYIHSSCGALLASKWPNEVWSYF